MKKGIIATGMALGVIVFLGMTGTSGHETERLTDVISSLEDKIEALERKIDNLEGKIDRLDYNMYQYKGDIIDKIEDVESAVEGIR
jgi:peptidoglycan hydrolase CwlO-like protein